MPVGARGPHQRAGIGTGRIACHKYVRESLPGVPEAGMWPSERSFAARCHGMVGRIPTVMYM